MGRSAFAPAKVNLFLHVGAPGTDGYHPLCSLMVFADCGDRLRVVPAEALSLRVDGPFAHQLGEPHDNLVVRAARALIARAGGPVAPVGVTLEKLLPVAAGLGADGAACLFGRPVLAQGRGEQLSPAPGMPALDAVLVNPRVALSTAEVYRALDAAGRFGDVTPPWPPDAFESVEELAAWLQTTRNDLQAPALALAPEVGAVLETLADEPETLLARMSGSGATCFALCPGDIEAEALTERLEAMEPRWWVRRCRLGGPWPEDT